MTSRYPKILFSFFWHAARLENGEHFERPTFVLCVFALFLVSYHCISSKSISVEFPLRRMERDLLMLPAEALPPRSLYWYLVIFLLGGLFSLKDFDACMAGGATSITV
jgi:hypothetical protein